MVLLNVRRAGCDVRRSMCGEVVARRTPHVAHFNTPNPHLVTVSLAGMHPCATFVP